MKQFAIRISQKILMTMACLLATMGAIAQVTVTGTVVDPDGEPMIAATVLEQGTSNGVATDFDGNFTINVSNPDATLVVSYVGFSSQEVPLAGRTQVKVIMDYSAVMLNEVVAIGYGTVKKSDATGSVAIVKPDEIEAGIATSVQDMLVGQTPGVVVTTSGGPEGAANIRIRGGSSLSASNDPLIVVDGVPLSNDGVQGMSNPLAMINPESIESMTILKDASATAIYGSRASNGVIIITTKKGASGAPTLTFNANFYVDQAAKIWDVYKAGEFGELIKKYYGADSNAYAKLGPADTDWQREILRTTFSSDYALSIAGKGFDWLPYRFSLSYTNSNGILKDSSMDRMTFGMNLSPKFFNDHLSVNANAKGYYLRNQFVNNPIGSALSFDPTAPVYKDYPIVAGNSGQTELYGGYYGIVDANGKLDQNSNTNPMATIKDRHDVADVLRSNGNLQLDYMFHFLPELHANLNLGYDVSRSSEDIIVGQNTITSWLNHNKTGAGYENHIYQFRSNTLLDFYLNYRKDFEKIQSNLDATAGYSWQRFAGNGWHYGADSEGDRQTTLGYYNPTYDANLGGYALSINPETKDLIGKNYKNDEIDPSGNYHWKNHLQLLSFFGRVNYTFKDRYLATVTVRGDATSRFSPKNRWGIFPAVALGWRISEENFMGNARGWLSDLKLRLGYGVTGQQEVGSTCNYLPMYSIASPGSYYPTIVNGKTVYVSPYFLMGYNPDLKWESTATWNAALDFGFLNNRITGSVEAYLRKTTDLQSFVTVPAGSSTTNELFMNIGSMENYGVEFNITARPVVTHNFNWTLSYNVGWNHSEITSLYDDSAIIPTGGISGGNGNNVQAQRVGYAPYTFRLYQQVYDEAGKPIAGLYVDQNGDGQINDADLVMKHDRAPKVTMSMSNNFRWKKWDLGFSLRASLGNYVYNNVASNNTDITKLYDGTRGFQNVVKSDFYTEGAEYLSDYWLRNGAFLRCDNINLGHTWEDIANGISQLRLFIALQNAFIITKYNGLDPEEFSGIDNNAYPRSRTYSLGLVATF